MRHLAIVLGVLAACGGSSGHRDGDDIAGTGGAGDDGGIIGDAGSDAGNSTGMRYPDVDGDGYGDTARGVPVAGAPSGYIARGGDCNDQIPAIHPGATEVCDGADNDCDGNRDGAAMSPDPCTQLVGSYSGTYTHHTDEKVGMTTINQVDCTGTGSMTLQLGRNPALIGSFTCVYSGSLGGFTHNQSATLSANVDLTGHVAGTIEHTYGDNGKRTYTVTGTQTSTGIMLSGSGSWLPNPMSAVPWGVTFSFTASK